jgi:phage tail-like protein
MNAFGPYMLVFLLATSTTTTQVHAASPASAPFSIEIDGVAAGSFSEASGLTTETNSSEYRAGSTSHTTPRTVTGLHKYTNITLKRGTVSNSQLYDWFKGQVSKNVTLNVASLNGQRLTYHLSNCRPVKYTGPTLGAKGGSDVAIEELTLSCETISLGK